MAGNILGTTVYYDADCNVEKLVGKKITVLGYGSQGHAHALNLKENGMDVTIGLRKGSKSWTAAEEAGFPVKETGEAVKGADIVMVLIPDELQADTYANAIAPNLKKGAYLAFAHGFNIHFNKIVPPADANVFMVAPKGPGHLVRRTFQEGSGVPCLVAVEKDPSGDTMEIAKAWAAGIGAGRSGILETTFRQETETDLFGEQAVLCGGVCALMQTGFETLVEAGYNPVNAYFECVHEMKLIVDLIYEGGFQTMRNSISNTAEYGDYLTGPKMITEQTRQAMRDVLKDIQSGAFAEAFIKTARPASRSLRVNALRQKPRSRKVGAALRNLMPWIKNT